EMSAVSAQGLYQDLQALANWAPQTDDREDAGLDTVLTLAKAFSPVWEVLDAKVVIEGVHYGEREPGLSLTGDGGFKLAMPKLVESVRYEDIRPAGSDGPTFGTISLTTLRFHDHFSLILRSRSCLVPGAGERQTSCTHSPGFPGLLRFRGFKFWRTLIGAGRTGMNGQSVPMHSRSGIGR